MALPSGYTKLKYIQSSGTQYINTNFTPNHNTRIVMDAQLYPAPSGSGFLFGARTTSLSNSFTFLWYATPNAFRSDYGTEEHSIGTSVAATDRLKIDHNKNTITVNGTAHTHTAQSFTAPVDLFLFCANNNGTAATPASMRLYSCQIYDNGTLVRDFVPAKNSAGTAGLYDVVNNAFYTSAGSGAFTAGPLATGPVEGMGATINDATSYGITEGKALVNGTAYNVEQGKTLAGGTAYDVPAPPIDPTFANNSWEQIIKACQDDAVPDTWEVGDQKAMTINGKDYLIDIIDKDHDTYTAGGVAPLTFQIHDCYSSTTWSASQNVRWASSTMRTTTLPGILALMPAEVQEAVREVNKLTGASGGYSPGLVTSSDKLFLLSEYEVFGSNTYTYEVEGSKYAYYSSESRRTKTRNGSAVEWWLRSPLKSVSTSYGVATVGTSGNADSNAYNGTSGVSFAFCF